MLWLVGPLGDFADLQAALDAAAPGDVLFLDADFTGSYQVPVDLTIRSISGPHTLTAAPGAGDPVADGVLLVDGVQLTVIGVTLDGAGQYRVARVAGGGALDLQGSTLRGGSSPDDGGCVWVEQGRLTLTSSRAEGCVSGGNGGAVAISSGALTAADSEFTGNTAVDGGAIWTAAGGALTDVRYRGNHAELEGGAVAIVGGTAQLVANHFCGNSAQVGGALHATAPIDELALSVFWANEADTAGAAQVAYVTTAWGLDFVANRGFAGVAAVASDVEVVPLDVISVDHEVGTSLFDLFHPAFWLSWGDAVYTGSFNLPLESDPQFLDPTYPDAGCDTRGLQLGLASPARGIGDGGYSDDLGAYPCGVTDAPGDGVDDDCDGDDLCFADVDGDGFGTSAVVEGPSPGCDDLGESPYATDCDEGRADVYPGALDPPQGGDSNCDGYDLCPADADGDGHTSDRQRVVVGACPPSLGLDCDDGDPNIHLSAAEPCGVDLDCDGLVVECPPDTGAVPGDPTSDTAENGLVDSGADRGPPTYQVVGVSGGCGCRAATGSPTGWFAAALCLSIARRRAR
ncbi:MAG: putative metal-binding motif-containing protein [Myxococcota bacterium]